MCKTVSDGNGGEQLKFGVGEWIKFAGLMIVIMGIGVGAMRYFIKSEIKLSLQHHCITHHHGEHLEGL